MTDTPRPRVLLWGAKTKARIIDAMLVECGYDHARVLFDPLVSRPEFEYSGKFVNDVETLRPLLSEMTHYVVCIGGEHGYARYRTAQCLENHGLRPLVLVHDRAFIDPTASVGSGCQCMPFAVLHKFSRLGEQSILNTSATVDHECILGKGVHVMGSAAIAGKVEIGDFATIGTNATVLPFVRVGEGAFVGAGAVVREDVEPYTVVAGMPAKPMRRHEPTVNEALLAELSR